MNDDPNFANYSHEIDFRDGVETERNYSLKNKKNLK
jgi:hypothetical protein